jgi:hypothetical protein
MGDSGFRRLLLDTVTAVVTTRTPSTSSLVELLRVASPGHFSGSSSSSAAESAVRNDAPRRLRLYRALQSKIHPDRHVGDEKERATRLFQDVSSYYEKCVAIAESEQQREAGVDAGAEGGTHRDRGDDHAVDVPDAGGRGGGGDDDRGRSPSFPHRHHPAWGRWWRRPTPPVTAEGAHSDYVGSDEYPAPPSSRPRGGRSDGLLFPQRRRPRGGGGGGCAGKLACLCVVGIVAYIWLGDGDFDWDWDWEKARREYFPSWDGGP